jgi:hypothetical protein
MATRIYLGSMLDKDQLLWLISISERRNGELGHVYWTGRRKI